jgi:hypothetical protein
MVVLSFLKRYTWLVLFAIAVVLATIIAVLSRRKPTDGLTRGAVIKAELAGIRAEGELERRLAAKGAEAAKAEVERAYESEKHAMAESERKEAEELKADPVKLAGFLARAGARRRHRS